MVGYAGSQGVETVAVVTFEKLVVSPDDGTVMLLGTVRPDGYLYGLREAWWRLFERLGAPGVRNASSEVIHSSLGRLLPAPPSSGPPRLAISEDEFRKLARVAAAYNARPVAQKLTYSFRLTAHARFLHNKRMFSAETFESILLSDIAQTAQ
ncbi:hypothetical protein DIPPA_14429 [Diplonema papillatum]|nr:hypothetical protein DIPPA_14419 [Diplonema papillatum]KAJ9472130.1 hypothetical protein DIPPA_14429 [Diplonema papillatum]